MGVVLDDMKALAVGNRHDAIHVRALPKQMHGDNSFRLRGDGGLDRRRIDVERVREDIHKHRLGPDATHATGCGEEGKRRNDHLIARTDPQSHQRREDRIRPAAHANPVRHTAQCGQFGLESRHIGTENVLLRVQHTIDGRSDLRFDRSILRRKVKEWYFHAAQYHRIVRSSQHWCALVDLESRESS